MFQATIWIDDSDRPSKARGTRKAHQEERARLGENPRPRPKDCRQIQDYIKKNREESSQTVER